MYNFLILFFNCNLLLHCSQIMSEVSLTLHSSLPQFTLSFQPRACACVHVWKREIGGGQKEYRKLFSSAAVANSDIRSQNMYVYKITSP